MLTTSQTHSTNSKIRLNIESADKNAQNSKRVKAVPSLSLSLFFFFFFFFFEGFSRFYNVFFCENFVLDLLSSRPPLLLSEGFDAGTFRPRLQAPPTGFRQIIGIKDALTMLISAPLTAQSTSATVSIPPFLRIWRRRGLVGGGRRRRESRVLLT